jgi:predicted site-specific integrase-resolvase
MLRPSVTLDAPKLVSSGRDSDSTLGGVVESMTRMTRAVLYARVSSDLQTKEGTIESQVAELKRQIAEAGHVLVKEYIETGTAAR